MKDLAGNTLKVGDRVAYASGGRYHTFALATVAGFTPKMVRIDRGKGWGTQNANPGSLVCIREPDDSSEAA